MKVFVSGGAGFIGSNLCNMLDNLGYEVIAADNLDFGKKSNLKNNIKFKRINILDKKKLFRAVKGCEIIFHLAAKTSVPESIIDPNKYFLNNIEGTFNILESARINKIKYVVFSSSAAVYGNNSPPLKESFILNPKSPYALSKKIGEELCRYYFENYNINCACLRYMNIYGPKQRNDSPYSGVISIILKCMISNKEFKMYGNGNQKRDFVFVDDVARANIFFSKNKGFGIYNIGSGKKVSINEIIKIIEKTSGKNVKIKKMPKRIGDIKDSYADISKTKKKGFVTKKNLYDGIKETYNYFLNNE
jgi:nucleoside-diphosphate-sugar epimerase